MLDLTNECEQREFARGPVPDGSIVMVEIEILKPNQERQAHDNPFISRGFFRPPANILPIHRLPRAISGCELPAKPHAPFR